jgi:hypothetical protein
MTEVSKMSGMIMSCIEWLDDWTQDSPPLLDEYDLTQWIDEELSEMMQEFLKLAFRKSKTRTGALEVMRALCWEHYLFQKEAGIHCLPKAADDAVKKLLSLPQTAQKSAAWHAESRDLLTGHEFGIVVGGTDYAIGTLVAKKCAPEVTVNPEECDVESRTVFTGKLSPFQWGWRYEPVIRALFETEIAKGRVDDTLGRIRHPTLPRLAASPDGLICDGPKHGHLVEIKAPITRVLTGQIPADYYCQMQLQAEVTDSPAVEYIEMKFAAKLAEEFENDSQKAVFLTPSPHSLNRMGAVLVIAPPVRTMHNDDGEEYEVEDTARWKYVYSDAKSLSADALAELLAWLPTDLPNGWRILERSVWKVEDYFTQTVPRNKRWWAEIGQPAYEDFWVRADAARSEGKYKPKLLIESDSDSE